MQMERREVTYPKKDVEGCLAVIFGFAAIPILTIYRGWVFSLLWAWFAVPAFKAPQIGTALAIGLLTIFGMLTAKLDKSKKDEDQLSVVTYAFSASAIYITVSLLVGLAAKQFTA